MNLLFVYGTLQKGRIKKVLPQVAPFMKKLANGFVKAVLFDMGDYPAAKPTKAVDKKVFGELIEIVADVENVLKALDEYEEVKKDDAANSLYIRKKAEVTIDSGEKFKAWIYWYNQEVKSLKEIKSGVFRKRNKV
jgi:gamma-glutamylcyclotransferase (GGCT)/AIG2-like uncharacterized protein YtfP